MKIEKDKIIIFMIIILLYGSIASFVAHYTYNTDFPSFYRAGNIILDPATPNNTVYETSDTANKYNIPEKFVLFRFSIPAAYIIAPIAFLSYETAKSFLIFIEIVLYSTAVFLVLRLGGASGRLLFYPFVLSLLWMPFLLSPLIEFEPYPLIDIK